MLLFLYAAPFSVAYLDLTAATGALILFGAVQVTMIGLGTPERGAAEIREWAGLVIALVGLVGLTLPGIAAPPFGAACLMALAGAAWGGYSLRGRGSKTPLTDTARSFLFASPLALAFALLAIVIRPATLHPVRVGYAALSGAIASGAGYAVWYTVLPKLSATRAGTIQLAVPVLAALAGIVLLDEHISVRLILSGAAILGGIGLAIMARKTPDPFARTRSLRIGILKLRPNVFASGGVEVEHAEPEVGMLGALALLLLIQAQDNNGSSTEVAAKAAPDPRTTAHRRACQSFSRHRRAG